MARIAPTSFAHESSHTGDMTLPTLDPIDTLADRETIIQPADDFLQNARFLQAAFMEDVMTIRIERGREKHAPQWVDVHVNGVVQWIRIGVKQNIKRKFVEVLARSQPFSVETSHGNSSEERPQNRVMRNSFAQYPFSVQHDPSPLGDEWLQRIFGEN